MAEHRLYAIGLPIHLGRTAPNTTVHRYGPPLRATLSPGRHYIVSTSPMVVLLWITNEGFACTARKDKPLLCAITTATPSRVYTHRCTYQLSLEIDPGGKKSKSEKYMH